MIIKITGTKPNLQLLQEQLAAAQIVPAITLRRAADPEDPEHALHDAEVWQLVIDLAVGLVGAGTYDAVKAAVAAARKRGRLEVEGLDDQSEAD